MRRKSGLVCPHCFQTLDPEHAKVIVASKNCYHCGLRVIRDEA